MVVMGRRLALPVLVLVYFMLLAVLGASARPLGGADWEAAGGTQLPGVVETLRRLYLQQLGGGPGASCSTNSPNNGCPP